MSRIVVVLSAALAAAHVLPAAAQDTTPWVNVDTWRGTAELRIANDFAYSNPKSKLTAKGRERTTATGQLELKTVQRMRQGNFGWLMAEGTWVVRAEMDLQCEQAYQGDVNSVTAKGGGSRVGTARLMVEYGEEGSLYQLQVEVAGIPMTVVSESRSDESKPIRIVSDDPMGFDLSSSNLDDDGAQSLPPRMTQLAGKVEMEHIGSIGFGGCMIGHPEVAFADPNMNQGTFSWTITPGGRARVDEGPGVVAESGSPKPAADDSVDQEDPCPSARALTLARASALGPVPSGHRPPASRVAGRKGPNQADRAWSKLTRTTPKRGSADPGEDAAWWLEAWGWVTDKWEGIQCAVEVGECIEDKVKEQAKERSALKEYEKNVEEFGEKMEPSLWEMCKELLGRQGAGGKINDALGGKDDAAGPAPSSKPRPPGSKKLGTYQE